MLRSLFLGLMLLFSLGIQAQTAKNPRVQIGVAVGLNISNLLSNNAGLNHMYDYRPRFFGGLSQQTAFGKTFLLRAEVNYEGMGTSFRVNLINENGDTVGVGRYNYNLHYARVPVLAKFRFGKGLVKGYVEVGGYIGILAVAKEGIDEKPGDPLNFVSNNTSNKFIRFDTGIAGGGGVEIPIFNEHTVFFGLRYSQGFLDVSKEDFREWNSAFNLHVGYLFQL